MKKKVVSLIMSVALAFSSMHVMNIAAENVKAESNLTEATVTNLNISTFLHVENSIFHMCFHTKRGIALRHATFLFCHICFVFKTYCHARKILPVPTVPIIRLMQVLQ